MWTTIFKTIRTSSFFKNTLILSIGTIIAQLVPMFFYPIVARLFTPAEFGLLATINAITGVITILSTGRYEVAILLTKSKQAAINLLCFIFLLSISVNIVIFVLFCGFNNKLGELLNEPLLSKYFYIPIMLSVTIMIYQCYNEWCVKFKYFKQLSGNKIINASAISISETSVGFMFPKLSGGLLFGDVLGRFISGISCLSHILYKERTYFKYVSLKKMFLYAKRFKDCLKFIMPGQLVNTISNAIPIFFIGHFFSQTELGFFSMASMIISLPATIVSRAVADSFRQRASEDYLETGSCREILIKTMKPLLLISGIGFTVLFFICPWLFDFVLGSQWKDAAIFAMYMIPIVAVSFISEIFGYVTVITEKMRYSLYWQIFNLLIKIIPIIIAYYYRDILVFLLALTICSVISHSLSLALSFYFSKKR